MSAPRTLEWSALMRAGLHGLGLSPDRFWNLTPAELRMMLGPLHVAPMDRGRLTDLMRMFPDNPKPDR